MLKKFLTVAAITTSAIIAGCGSVVKQKLPMVTNLNSIWPRYKIRIRCNYGYGNEAKCDGKRYGYKK
jgi:hypothetical protein